MLGETNKFLNLEYFNDGKNIKISSTILEVMNVGLTI